MQEIQAPFDKPQSWPPELLIAMGQLIIACSQREHIYELLWKDLGKTTALTLVDRLAEADTGIRGKNGIQELKESLATRN